MQECKIKGYCFEGESQWYGTENQVKHGSDAASMTFFLHSVNFYTFHVNNTCKKMHGVI